MNNLPTLAIVMVTFQRTREAVITLKSVCENLEYPREKRGWYIADDGSSADHMNAIFKELMEVQGETLWDHHSQKFKPGTHFCGMGWNIGLRKAHQYADIVLWLEDDWHLDRRLDIRPYVQLLEERSDIGIVRLGGLAVGSDVHIVGHNGIHYLQYQRSTQYAYSGNPLLRHKRFLDAYGWFHEERSPGEVELDMDAKFRQAPGPEIWRPADIPGWGIFGHIGTDKTW
jgi:hypothetical protein